ncbi:MAG TPA: rhodanese-like domain-containing protein [Edaphobacter sp.]|nr:rhodanese-like domain-containing protein [Edaphobacter sp.]
MVSIMVSAVLAIGVLIFAIIRLKRSRDKRELERYIIEPEALHILLNSNQNVLVVDVRQPLDLLAHSEIIPGAKRIPPRDVISNPSLIPKEVDTVVYCTCGSEKTSRDILQRALALNFSKVKLLRGGLAAWKEKGYSVVPYVEPFHLDTAG